MSMSMTSKVAWDRYLGGTLVYLLNFLARLLGYLLRRDHTLPARGDITVIKVLGGGSLVMALPALLGIRRKYPAVKMRLLTTAAVKPFAETLGVFDEILTLDDRSVVELAMSSLRCLRACYGSDTVIDLEIYSYLSTVLGIFTFARNRLGFFFEEAGLREKLHTHRIFFHPGSPLYSHYDRIAVMLEAPVVPARQCAEHVLTTLGIAARMPKLGGGRIAIGCGCSELSVERKLAPVQWSRHVFAMAPDKGRDVIFLGSTTDKRDAEKVIAAVRDLGSDGWRGSLTDLTGATSLAELAAGACRVRRILGIEFRAAALRAALRLAHHGFFRAHPPDAPATDAGARRKNLLSQDIVLALHPSRLGAALPRRQPLHEVAVRVCATKPATMKDGCRW